MVKNERQRCEIISFCLFSLFQPSPHSLPPLGPALCLKLFPAILRLKRWSDLQAHVSHHLLRFPTQRTVICTRLQKRVYVSSPHTLTNTELCLAVWKAFHTHKCPPVGYIELLTSMHTPQSTTNTVSTHTHTQLSSWVIYMGSQMD